MKRLKWLFEDTVAHSPLPFDSAQTQLQLLGFFVSEGQKYPAPLEMLLEANGQRYRSDLEGYLHKLDARNSYDMREPDIAVAPRAVPLGASAYAVSPTHILAGAEWQLRRDLRAMLKAEVVPPTTGLAVLNHLQMRPWQVLKARAYEHGGFSAYHDVSRWAELRQRMCRNEGRRLKFIKLEAPQKQPG